jgi:Domain of unknown function (DUF6265)
MRLAAIFFVLMSSAHSAWAGETRSLAPGGVSPRATIADAAWVVGRWVGEGFGAAVEEAMSPPMGNAMIGHFAMADKDGPKFYEIVQIREEKGSLVYRVKHFHPDLKGWEEKDKTIDFPLVAVEQGALYFDGLTIKRTGPDEVTHWVRVKGKDGKVEEAKLVYRRSGF